MRIRLPDDFPDWKDWANLVLIACCAAFAASHLLFDLW